jgi:hypothetical protein
MDILIFMYVLRLDLVRLIQLYMDWMRLKKIKKKFDLIRI